MFSKIAILVIMNSDDNYIKNLNLFGFIKYNVMKANYGKYTVRGSSTFVDPRTVD